MLNKGLKIYRKLKKQIHYHNSNQQNYRKLNKRKIRLKKIQKQNKAKQNSNNKWK